jgi:hypothetical protein
MGTVPGTLRIRRADSMTLLTLDVMPCGCVASLYQARPSVVEVEYVEAKGPHCVFSRHRVGRMSRLGLPDFPTLEGGPI